MPFTVTQPLGRLPTFAELQELAGQHGVHIAGNEQAGSFCYPDPQQPSVKGNYTFESDGDFHGSFAGQMAGKLAGSFAVTTGRAEITITEKPFLMPEAILKSKLSEALKVFCLRFSPEG